MADLLENQPELPVNPSEDANNDVRAAIAELKGEPAPVVQVADKPQTDAPVVDKPTDTRARNERGQFIKADGTVDPDQSPTKVPDADPSKVNIAEPSKVGDAPAGWSAEAKAEFSKAPPAVQAAVLKREAEMNEGGARWSEEKKTLLSHFEPVREISTQYKAHPAEVIKRLADADRFLERDPENALPWLAKAYGYSAVLSKLATGQPAADPTPTPQPQADQLAALIDSKLSPVLQRIEAEDQAKVNDTISAFASAPGHEHFEAVKTDVGHRLLLAHNQGAALTLEQAYEQAVWANADTRAKLIAAQTAPANDAGAKQREAAEKARRGALSAHGAPNGAVQPPKIEAPANSSVEDDVRAAYASLRH